MIDGREEQLKSEMKKRNYVFILWSSGTICLEFEFVTSTNWKKRILHGEIEFWNKLKGIKFIGG